MRGDWHADGVTLMLGDCLERLSEMEMDSVDAVITDPPYLGLKGGLKHECGGVTDRVTPTVTVGTPWGSDLSALREFRRVAKYGAIVFCSWHSIGQVKELLGGEAVGLVTWYKRNTQPSFRNRPHYACEYAWLIEYSPGMDWKLLKTMYDIPNLPAGCFATERILKKGTKKAAHPTQKPLELITAFVETARIGMTVLDPYMGTGTTGVACVKTGRKFIGIEKLNKPGYFPTAQERIAEELAKPRQIAMEMTI